MRHVSIASAIALMAFGSIGVAGAQTYGDESSTSQKPKMTGEQNDLCAQNPEACQPRRSRQIQTEDTDMDAGKPRRSRQVQTEDMDMDAGKAKKEARADTDWRYDSDRHQRRRYKDARFRFFLGGYWYPEPYWLVRVGPRVSCGEGKLIVRDHGFRRVRTVECQGRTYTYLGHNYRGTFRVQLSARSGRVIDIDRV